MAKPNKKLITALKIGVSLLLFYFIFSKISFKEVLGVLGQAKIGYLLLAVILFVVSKVLAAFRLNAYLHQLTVKLTQLSNLKLYLLGMFYNLFLPGGIGGDAYKGYLIQKKFQVGGKKVAGVLVLDRLSGLLLLFIYACLLGIAIDNPFLNRWQWALIAAIPLAVLSFWLLNKWLFNYALPVLWKSIGYSALVQLAQLVCVFCILYALQIPGDAMSYLFIFLLSSIVAVLPLTIGGIGSREVTFLYGAQWLGLQEDYSISISMVFFMITALVSLFGAIYHIKQPQLSVEKD